MVKRQGQARARERVREAEQCVCKLLSQLRPRFAIRLTIFGGAEIGEEENIKKTKWKKEITTENPHNFVVHLGRAHHETTVEGVQEG
jgi:hypothetical protein